MPKNISDYKRKSIKCIVSEAIEEYVAKCEKDWKRSFFWNNWEFWNKRRQLERKRWLEGVTGRGWNILEYSYRHQCPDTLQQKR